MRLNPGWRDWATVTVGSHLGSQLGYTGRPTNPQGMQSPGGGRRATVGDTGGMPAVAERWDGIPIAAGSALTGRALMAADRAARRRVASIVSVHMADQIISVVTGRPERPGDPACPGCVNGSPEPLPAAISLNRRCHCPGLRCRNVPRTVPGHCSHRAGSSPDATSSIRGGRRSHTAHCAATTIASVFWALLALELAGVSQSQGVLGALGSASAQLGAVGQVSSWYPL